MTISDVIAEYQERYGTKRTLLALTIILDRMENEKGHGHGEEIEITNLRTRHAAAFTGPNETGWRTKS